MILLGFFLKVTEVVGSSSLYPDIGEVQYVSDAA